MNRSILTPLILSFLALSLTPAAAQDRASAARINELLDRQIEPLELREEPLPQVMERFTAQTGVPLQAHAAVWELLPWGRQTTIVKADLQNMTVRAALEAITRTLGLTFALRDETVEIRPMPALFRLGRQAMVGELQLLDLLARTPMELDTDRPTVRELIEAVDARLEAVKPEFDVEFRADAVLTEEQRVYVPRNATIMGALESIVKQTDATWYPWQSSVLIVPKETLIRSQLQKAVNLDFANTDAMQVLNELSQRSGVPFTIEPGAIQKIPAEFRTIRLMLDNATVAQALENLAGFTGLAYRVRAEDVYIWHEAAAAAPSPPADDAVVLILPLPDLGVQVPLRKRDVPEDLLEFIQARTTRALEQWQEMRDEEQAQPEQAGTGQPAPGGS